MNKGVRLLTVALMLGIFVFALALPCGAAAQEGLSVKLIVNPSVTDIDLNAGRVALTARARGVNLSFDWKLTGPGKIEGSGPSVFYILPASIDGEATKALVSVTVKEKDGQETTETVAFNIRAGSGASSAGMSTGTKIAIGAGAAAVIGGGLALAGGGGGGGDSSSDAYVEGTWNWQAAGYDNMTITLTQDGSSFSGFATGGYATGITGSVSGSSITMTITFEDGLVMDATGTISGDENSMGGGYTDHYPGEATDSGSWSATRQ